MGAVDFIYMNFFAFERISIDYFELLVSWSVLDFNLIEGNKRLSSLLRHCVRRTIIFLLITS